ncbi:hypothetical protein [Paenibacillus kandeliae]|uniref:hypothetical protein n=1 Tax=Paenibacillus kandeliae TaxID=3231269 RepID=UPI00345B0984
MRVFRSSVSIMILMAMVMNGCSSAESADRTAIGNATASAKQPNQSLGPDETQIQGAMQAAAKYLKSQYSVDGVYTQKDLKQQVASMKQKLKPLLNSEYYTWADKNKTLTLPLQIAIHEHSSATPKDITIRSRTVSNTEQLIRLSYRLNFHLNERNESAPLGGKLIMEHENGVWRVASDQNNADSLLEWHGISTDLQ